MRCAEGAAGCPGGHRRELALEELVEGRAWVAHDVAVEPEQRLGDLGPMGIKFQRVGGESIRFM